MSLAVHSPARSRRGVLVVLAVVAAGLLALFGPAGSATAANYQYWSYWQLTNGAWTFSQQGPQQTVPADGSVEGWRWAVDDGSGTRTPRAKPTFEQLCAATTAGTGSKRVGVLIDFGREVDGGGTTPQPPLLATCAVVPTAATGADVLAGVASVRTDKSMVCGIQGFPATGCGGEVATLTDAQKAADTPVALPSPTPTPISASSAATSSSGSSTSVVTVVAIGLAVVLVVVLLVMGSRRRNRTGA
ncbi:MAG: SCO2322 family protein [Dermatophilaceae bacterium]